jgi:hypothetical protein
MVGGRRRLHREGLHEWYFVRERPGVLRAMPTTRDWRLIQGEEPWPWKPWDDGRVYLVGWPLTVGRGAFRKLYTDPTSHRLTETQQIDSEEFDAAMRNQMEDRESGIGWQLTMDEEMVLKGLLAKKGCPAQPWEVDEVTSTHLNPRGGRGSA